jgi:beta-glucosidase
MAELGLRAYRFSIAWTRIQPDGRGSANPEGIDHYRRLITALRERDIEPVVTLFHWDLPQALEDEGGWPVREIADRFGEYAAIVGDALGDLVDRWITLNEPWVMAWLGYGEGIHAPGRQDTAAALAAAHHQLLAHRNAVEALDGRDVGISLNLEPHRPVSGDDADVRAARLGEQHMNGWFLDPLWGRGYPAELLEHYAAAVDLSFVREGDLDRIAGPPAFLGINYYRPQLVAADPNVDGVTGPLPGSFGGYGVVRPGSVVTAMGWPVDASGLAGLLGVLRERYAPSRILITENGAAFDDEEVDGAIDDADRIAYLEAHLTALAAAIDDRVPVEGYLVWSLLDNFEWAEGYAKRFGIVSVDRATQRRTPKASARWFADIVAGTSRAGS